ncbi:MAG: hypothetical protein ACLRIS_13025 [Flavonifractor plautii]
MRERVPMTDFARQWAEHVAASASPRMTDDQAERDFWHAFMTRKTYAPGPPPSRCWSACAPAAGPRGGDRPGGGARLGQLYLTLAELCREVACVDLSRDVLDFVLRAGRSAAGTISPPSMPSGRAFTPGGGTIWFSAITASTGRRIWPTASGGWTGRRTSCAWRA